MSRQCAEQPGRPAPSRYQRTHPPPGPPPPPPPGPLRTFNSTLKPGYQYIWNTQPMNFSAAEQYCNDNGGHLAAYRTLAEQKDAETYFKSNGLLLPTFHRAYWIGLQSDVWPKFYWLDSVTPNPSSSTYQHWGTYSMGGKSIPEPNNIVGTETCGAANLTQSYSAAAGWSDVDCSRKLPFMCLVMRE